MVIMYIKVEVMLAFYFMTGFQRIKHILLALNLSSKAYDLL